MKPEIVRSPLGKVYVDYKGAPISGVRMDVSKAYDQIPVLLQKVINDNDNHAWTEIGEKIDYIYSNLNYALAGLDEETSFGKKVQKQIRSGKKLFFKPNIVTPLVIDPRIHGEDIGATVVTEWPLIAALMRWFHDKLNISYYEMAIGEASTSTFLFSSLWSKDEGKSITTEAIMEGRSGDFYGGWGFFFVRKYLSERHPASHQDDPMKGYEDSVTGRFIPPGRTKDRLMVYDLNKIYDGFIKERKVAVPGGTVFKEIILSKVIVGGEPHDNKDLKDYPGCVLVNVPKTKMHAQDLITNAIKNLGIGLYPTQKYSSFKTIPSFKDKLPHSPWVLKIDPETHLPVKDENGKYIATKTDGLSGVQSDVIQAVQSQNVFMLHVVDGINIINLSHNPDPIATRVPEGYVWSSLDCVALDLFCARYCFKTVPMDQALELQEVNQWPTEFVHHSPEAIIKGKNIVTQEGLDSPLFRYDLYRYAEERGVGQQKYYIVGWDSLTGTPLASIKGHLGRIHDKKFLELITHNIYFNFSTILQDFQKGIFSYAKACDQLTGTSLFKNLMDTFDENHDGIIDYDEKGRGNETAQLVILSYSLDILATQPYGDLKRNFIVNSLIKYMNKNWNPQGHNFMRESLLEGGLAQAYMLSQSENVKADLFIPGMSYGKGMWPSWHTSRYIYITTSIYGSQSPKNISLSSLYGSVFQYADKVLNAGAYTGNISQFPLDPSGDIQYGDKIPDTDVAYNTSNPDSINNYFKAVAKGAEPLGFTFYVPKGYGSLEGVKIPNVKETADPGKTFTVHFRFAW